MDSCARLDRSPIAVERRRSMLALQVLAVVCGDPRGVRRCGCDVVCNVQPTTGQAGMATHLPERNSRFNLMLFCSPRGAFYFYV